MLSVVVYHPGSELCNCNGNPHMGAIVVSMGLNDECYQAIRWIARDDLENTKSRKWVEGQAMACCQEILDEHLSDIIPKDIVNITPQRG